MGLFSKKQILFPDLKIGDQVVLKDDYWDGDGIKCGFSWPIITGLALKSGKLYRVTYIDQDKDVYVESGDFVVSITRSQIETVVNTSLQGLSYEETLANLESERENILGEEKNALRT